MFVRQVGLGISCIVRVELIALREITDNFSLRQM